VSPQLPRDDQVRVRLIHGNVGRPSKPLKEQAAGLAAWSPDIVALQEITTATSDPWRSVLRAIGFTTVELSLDLPLRGPAPPPPRPAKAGALVASR
jgi:hypothetical protein